MFLVALVRNVAILLALLVIAGGISLLAPKKIISPELSPGFSEIDANGAPTLEENGAPLEAEQTTPSEVPSEQKPTPKEETNIVPTLPSIPTLPVPEPSLSVPQENSPITPSFSTINEEVRAALVNIFCLASAGSGVRSIAGSGVMIDGRGVILTNAHIGQYFLLFDYPAPGNIDCVIRTGSPARNTYRAELLYLSPEWLAENADIITSETPTGTGKGDYALLRITGMANPDLALPSSFPAIDPETGESSVEEGTDVLVAGYPAGFLGSDAITKDLYASSAVSQIGKLYTFGIQTIDIFSVGGTVVAQKGASGGAVVNRQEKLLGLIVTATDAETTGERDLRALSLPYIYRDFQIYNNSSLETYLAGDLATRATAFNNFIAPALKNLLIQEIEK